MSCSKSFGALRYLRLNETLLSIPAMTNPTTRSLSFAPIIFRKADVCITGPVAHFVPIFSECKLSSKF